MSFETKETSIEVEKGFEEEKMTEQEKAEYKRQQIEQRKKQQKGYFQTIYDFLSGGNKNRWSNTKTNDIFQQTEYEKDPIENDAPYMAYNETQKTEDKEKEKFKEQKENIITNNTMVDITTIEDFNREDGEPLLIDENNPFVGTLLNKNSSYVTRNMFLLIVVFSAGIGLGSISKYFLYHSRNKNREGHVYYYYSSVKDEPILMKKLGLKDYTMNHKNKIMF